MTAGVLSLDPSSTKTKPTFAGALANVGKSMRLASLKQGTTKMTLFCTVIVIAIIMLDGGKCWRRERDSNPRYSYPYVALARRCLKPLGHLSSRNMQHETNFRSGGRGIRTPDTLSRITVFKTAAISHSAIPPRDPKENSDLSLNKCNPDGQTVSSIQCIKPFCEGGQSALPGAGGWPKGP